MEQQLSHRTHHHDHHQNHHHDPHDDAGGQDGSGGPAVRPARTTADPAAPHRCPPPPAAAVVLRWAGGRPVVHLGGEVDLAAGAQLQSLRVLLAQHGQRLSAVDASGVSFLDAGGLRALLELVGPGGSLLVLHPSPAVRRLLALAERSGLGPAVLRAGPPEEALVLRDASGGTAGGAPAALGVRHRPRALR